VQHASTAQVARTQAYKVQVEPTGTANIIYCRTCHMGPMAVVVIIISARPNVACCVVNQLLWHVDNQVRMVELDAGVNHAHFHSVRDRCMAQMGRLGNLALTQPDQRLPT
jgi:hypothetical protein